MTPDSRHDAPGLLAGRIGASEPDPPVAPLPGAARNDLDGPVAAHEPETGIPARLGHLAVRGGMPVPWVAIWSAEARGSSVKWTPRGIVPDDITLASRSHGMWMMSVSTDRTGTPDFGSTHSARQRDCMLFTRCQVCGTRTPPEAALWVVPHEKGHDKMFDDERRLINPPTCPACFGFASTVCPHLRAGGVRAYRSSEESRIVAIQGHVSNREGRWHDAIMDLTNPDRVFMLGRQYIVQLIDPVRVTL